MNATATKEPAIILNIKDRVIFTRTSYDHRAALGYYALRHLCARVAAGAAARLRAPGVL